MRAITGDTSRIVQGDMSDEQFEMLAAICFPMPNVPARCPNCAVLHMIPMRPADAEKELARLAALGCERLNRRCGVCEDMLMMWGA